MRSGRFIILLVSLLSLCVAAAQQPVNYSFRHLTQADGLLHNLVFSIVQDSRGFIWIATANGLQRYDGSRFVYYPEMLSSPAQVLTSGVNMYADKNNNQLWITNYDKIEKLELGKNNFTVYNKEELTADPSFIFTSYQGANNEQWLLSPGAVYRYDSIIKKYVSHTLNILPANSRRSNSMSADSPGNNTWVATRYHLYLFDKKSKQVYSANFNPGNHPLLKLSALGPQGKNLRFIMIDSRQDIWVSSWDGMLFRYDNETKKVSNYSLSVIKTRQESGKPYTTAPVISCIMEDDHNNIWLATEGGGLLRYNQEKDDFDYCIAQENNSETIQYNYSIYCLFQDKEQNIWVGTDKGISIFNPYRQYFRSVKHEKNNALSISKSEITSAIQTSTGDIVIGTWGGGITLYDSYFVFKKNILFPDLPSQKNFTWSLVQVDAETIWIGCQHGYLQVYNVLTGATQSLHPPEMEGSTILCMEKDNKGNIYFGLYNGKIAKWDKQQRKFFASGGSAKPGTSVLTIFFDRVQQCWVSTLAGFKQFDAEKMVYSNSWLPDTNNARALYGNTCRGIAEYNDSTLLIGTIYGGLNFFNKQTKTFSHLTMKDGLPANNIYAIKKDSTGCVWLTTDYGLCKYNPADNKIIPYGMEPGLIRSSFISNKFLPLQDGQWLTFTGTEAISFIPQNPVYRNDTALKVELTGFRIFDLPILIDSLLYGNKPIRLSYKQNFFTIEFAALNFSNLVQTNYYYRLVGVDKEWVAGGTKRSANYTDLQPGEYIFNVKAEQDNSTGEMPSFRIIISPPFWKTTWFRLVTLLLSAALVYLLFRRQGKTIRREAGLKQRIVETEMMASPCPDESAFYF